MGSPGNQKRLQASKIGILMDKVAKELLVIAKELTSEVLEVNFSDAQIRRVMKKLSVGDKVLVTYNDNQRGGRVDKRFTINTDWETNKEAGAKRLTVGIISRGSPHGRSMGQGGSIKDEGNEIVFQSTMRQQVRKVIELKKA